MIKYIASITAAICLAFTLKAQEISPAPESEVTAIAAADSTALKDSVLLKSRAIFDRLGQNVTISQDESIVRPFAQYASSTPPSGLAGLKNYTTVVSSSGRTMLVHKGKAIFRIRIYADNAQNAREVSSSEMARFQKLFPGESASRSYSSPFFKVTVGNYENRKEAEEALKIIKGYFPMAYIVRKEN